MMLPVHKENLLVMSPKYLYVIPNLANKISAFEVNAHQDYL